jgi:hypothetical protein
MGQLYTQLPVVILPPSPGSLPKELKTIPDEIFEYIFKKLDMWSIEAVARTCRRFRLIFESDKISLMDITCVVSNNGAIKEQHMRHLEYPFKLICLDLELLPRPKFNVAVQRGEIKRSTGCHKKALLWIYEGEVTYEAFETYRKSVSEFSDAPIFLFEGDPVLLRYKIPGDAKQPLGVVSYKYLCISGGCLSQDWPSIINGFEGPQWIYFKPGGSYNEVTKWNINTPETLFIMESVFIKVLSGDIE